MQHGIWHAPILLLTAIKRPALALVFHVGAAVVAILTLIFAMVIFVILRCTVILSGFLGVIQHAGFQEEKRNDSDARDRGE